MFRATHRQTGLERAIKVVRKTDVSDEDTFRNEFKILMELDHPNIIKLFEIYETDDFIHLVQE